MQKADVAIIGAGVIGSSIARELSRYNLKTIVLEKASDVCEGTSKANSGICHAGYDAMPGTLKARFNVEGNRMMEELSRELDFPFKRNGSLVLCFDEADMPKLFELKERGKANGVEGLEILEKDKVRKKEPNISNEVVAALYAPTGGIVCPFGLTIAMAENAFVNGTEFFLNTEVTDIKKTEDYFEIAAFNVKGEKESFEARTVINAAGVYADKIHNMISKDKIRITARKGEYCLYDKTVGNTVSSTVFQLPGSYGKGVLVTPTVHGNLLIGPTAVDIDDKEGVNTTKEGLDLLVKRASKTLVNVPGKYVITSFAGLRAHSDRNDFIIGESEVKGFIDVAGIESPGLSAAPAIGVYVAEMVKDMFGAKRKDNFISQRKGIKSIALLSNEEREKLIKENPLYGNVVCRCELVTEGEIVDSILRPLGARTLDGVKRRTRAGMGRCQSGFCSPTVVSILADKLNVKMEDITKHGPGSEFVWDHK